LNDIHLDLGCGFNKAKNRIGMDNRKIEGVDIVHDLEVIPYPLDNDCCLSIRCSQVVEHLKPWLMIGIMDEWWRIMKPNCKIYIATPPADSFWFHVDPTHIKGWNDSTVQYFDPRAFLYTIYRPKPWLIRSVEKLEITLEFLLEKISEEEGIKLFGEAQKKGYKEGDML